MSSDVSSLRRFRDALFAFSDDPTPSNLARYLAASRDLAKERRGPAASERARVATAMSSGLSGGHS
jgi:hypothetical protein